ncbi:MAG: glycosyltransferase family 4 protein [Thermoplasmata archaeon]|nr:glycosyltransferase family 4 protein [Thermoplasmata archaeon]MCI4359817.1 glycosyltransferase family 4 protein [Thermoplasmata archaeon]
MKIAELSTRYPPGPGGVERHVREIAVRLAQGGDSVGVYTTELEREYPWRRLDRSVPREEVRDGVSIHRLRAISLPGEFHYPFVRGLATALRRDRPEIVHVHTYGTNQAAIARRYSKRTATPYVITAHYHPIWSIEGGWVRHRIRGFYDRVLAAPVMASARAVIVQSEEEERLIRANGFPLPTVVRIPPGYTPLPPPPSGDRPFAASLDLPGPFLLFVGRLASNKGFGALLPAFARLSRHDPSASLVLVGADGGQRPLIERTARELGMEARVRIVGHVEDEARLAAAFREARVFVLASEYEAFGLVLLEALAQGTPVVASRVGGIPEFIEDQRAGLLVPPGDPKALSEALLALWDDPERRHRLGEYGRTQVVPRYSWEGVVGRLHAVFEDVVGR